MTLLRHGSAPFLKLCAQMGNRRHPDRNKDVYIVSGSPRGGTTWLAESLARLIKTRRVYWEPLQDGNISLPSSLRDSKRPFIGPFDMIGEDSKQFFDDLINARLANAHMIRLRKQPSNLVSLLRSPAPPLIKFVRGNGVLGYLHQNYDIHKPVVIMRHPCAVIASQLNMGLWEDHPHVNPKLLDRYPRLKDIVSKKKNLHQRLAMSWAGDILAAREHPEHVHILYYEDLVQMGAEALTIILEDWGMGKERVDEAILVPSSTIHEWTDLTNIESKLGRWKQQLSDEMVEDILNIVADMGVEDYGSGLLPNRL